MYVFFCCVSAIHVFVSLSGDSAVIFGSHRAALYNLYNVALEYLMHLCISATRRSRSDVSQSVSHFMLASILLMWHWRLVILPQLFLNFGSRSRLFLNFPKCSFGTFLAILGIFGVFQVHLSVVSCPTRSKDLSWWWWPVPGVMFSSRWKDYKDDCSIILHWCNAIL